MVRIAGDRWITLNELMDQLGDSTTKAEVLTVFCLAFKDGLVDDRGLLLIDEVSGRPLSPKVQQLCPYLFPLRHRIFVSKDFADHLRLEWNRPPPCCTDPVNGANPASRPSPQLALASAAMIRGETRLAYERAKADGLKPPNIVEVSRIVQLALKQKGFRASLLQIQKVAEEDEFKACRLPPGKRWSSRKK